MITLKVCPSIEATCIVASHGPMTGMRTASRPACMPGSPMQLMITASMPSRSASMMRATVAGVASISSKSDSIEAGPWSISTWLSSVSGRSRGTNSSIDANPCVVIGVMTRSLMVTRPPSPMRLRRTHFTVH